MICKRVVKEFEDKKLIFADKGHEEADKKAVEAFLTKYARAEKVNEIAIPIGKYTRVAKKERAHCRGLLLNMVDEYRNTDSLETYIPKPNEEAYVSTPNGITIQWADESAMTSIDKVRARYGIGRYAQSEPPPATRYFPAGHTEALAIDLRRLEQIDRDQRELRRRLNDSRAYLESLKKEDDD